MTNIVAEFSEVLGFPVEVFEEFQLEKFLQILVEFFNWIHFRFENLLKSVAEWPIK